MVEMSWLLTRVVSGKVTLSLFFPLPLRLCLSDKLFGKRLLQAGRHFMSHKSWMKTVPTENCDVLMTFAGEADKDTNRCDEIGNCSV